MKITPPYILFPTLLFAAVMSVEIIRAPREEPRPQTESRLHATSFRQTRCVGGISIPGRNLRKQEDLYSGDTYTLPCNEMLVKNAVYCEQWFSTKGTDMPVVKLKRDDVYYIFSTTSTEDFMRAYILDDNARREKDCLELQARFEEQRKERQEREAQVLQKVNLSL